MKEKFEVAKSQVRFSFRIKLMVALSVVSILPIVLLSYYTFQSSTNFFKKNVLYSLEGIADLKTQAIDTFVEDRIQEIEGLSTLPSIVWHMGNLNKKIKRIEEVGKEPKESKESIEKEPIEPALSVPEKSVVMDDVTPAVPAQPETQEALGTETEAVTLTPKQEANSVKVELKKKQTEESPQYQALKRALNLILAKGKKYEELFILDPSGIVQASTHYEHEGMSEAHSAYFSSGIKSTFIQDTYVAGLTERQSMVISTPIKNEIDKVVGVLAARLNLGTLHQLIKGKKGLGETGETIVGKKIVDDIIFMAPTRYDDNAAATRRIEVGSQLEFPLQEAARGREGYGMHQDYRGTAVLATWRFIPSLKWGLVVKLDGEEAMLPLINARNQIGMVAGALIIFVIFLSTFFSKSVVRPLRELTEAANSISRGDMNVKLRIRQGDEVGDLANSFERMVAAIRILKEDQ
jgi:HAMP domain-containing protein